MNYPQYSPSPYKKMRQIKEIVLKLEKEGKAVIIPHDKPKPIIEKVNRYPKDVPLEQIKSMNASKLEEVDTKREPCSMVFIGHVDAGKSTICGNLLFLSGVVDQRTI